MNKNSSLLWFFFKEVFFLLTSPPKWTHFHQVRQLLLGLAETQRPEVDAKEALKPVRHFQNCEYNISNGTTGFQPDPDGGRTEITCAALWGASGSCIQGRGSRDSNWRTPLCQQHLYQVRFFSVTSSSLELNNNHGTTTGAAWLCPSQKSWFLKTQSSFRQSPKYLRLRWYFRETIILFKKQLFTNACVGLGLDKHTEMNMLSRLQTLSFFWLESEYERHSKILE